MKKQRNFEICSSVFSGVFLTASSMGKIALLNSLGEFFSLANDFQIASHVSLICKCFKYSCNKVEVLYYMQVTYHQPQLIAGRGSMEGQKSKPRLACTSITTGLAGCISNSWNQQNPWNLRNCF